MPKYSYPDRENARWYRATALLLALLILCLPLGIWGLNQAELTAELNQLVNSPLVKNAELAIAVFDPTDSSAIYSYRTDVSLIPASVTKFFTSAAALTALHPDFRFQTQIGFRGEIIADTILGDLVIEAGGDPSWTTDFFTEGAHRVFEIWADSLAAHGISSISGNIVVNTSLYPTQLFSSFWDPLDKPYYYAPPIGPLSFNENAIDLEITGAEAVSRPARAMAKYNYGYMNIDNRVKTSARSSQAKTWYRRSPAPHTTIVNGSVPVGKIVTLSPSIDDPLAFCVQTMAETFRKRGIRLSGEYSTQKDSISVDPPTPLFSYSSVELQDINKVMMKSSSNFMAEMLFHYLGGGDEGVAKPVAELCAEIGSASPTFKIVDGSGLAKQNRMSPADLGRLLCHSYHQPWFPTYLQALPIAGVDGTMKRRLGGADSKAQVFAKTGGMSGISSLAGYFKAADDQLYAFVIMGNKLSSTANCRKWEDLICEQLILFDGRE